MDFDCLLENISIWGMKNTKTLKPYLNKQIFYLHLPLEAVVHFLYKVDSESASFSYIFHNLIFVITVKKKKKKLKKESKFKFDTSNLFVFWFFFFRL